MREARCGLVLELLSDCGADNGEASGWQKLCYWLSIESVRLQGPFTSFAPYLPAIRKGRTR